MKAVVTGGAGFIGSHLVDALIDRGVSVLVLDDLSRGQRSRVNANAEFIQADIADSGAIAALSNFSPQAVFHLAAQIDVRRSLAEPTLDTRINVLGTVNLLQASAAAGVQRFIFASSGGAVYGDAGTIPTPETTPCHPESAYGAAKFAGEVYGQLFARLYGLQFTALRYTNVYGPRQDPHGEAGVVAIFAQRLLSGQKAIVNGDGGQTRDYVYVADVVNANMAALEGEPGVYNIGTGRECDVNQLYALIARNCSVDSTPEHAPAKPGEQKRSCVDASLAGSKLGWAPAMALEDGVARTVEYFRGQVPASA